MWAPVKGLLGGGGIGGRSCDLTLPLTLPGQGVDGV